MTQVYCRDRCTARLPGKVQVKLGEMASRPVYPYICVLHVKKQTTPWWNSDRGKVPKEYMINLSLEEWPMRRKWLWRVGCADAKVYCCVEREGAWGADGF